MHQKEREGDSEDVVFAACTWPLFSEVPPSQNQFLAYGLDCVTPRSSQKNKSVTPTLRPAGNNNLVFHYSAVCKSHSPSSSRNILCASINIP